MADEEKVIDENTTPNEDTEDTETPENTEEGTDTEDTNEIEDGKEEDKGEEVKPEDVDLNNPEEVSEALAKKDIDYNALSEEYMANGKLSDETLEMLEKAGIPKEMTANYIKGYEAIVEKERNELAEVVGGKEQFDELINWCANNLKKEEIVSLNAIRDKFQLQLTLIGLKVRMEEKEGKTPEYQKGTGDKTVMVGFRSKAEMYEAIRDPKYKVDEAYRADVTKKIAASREAGIDLGIY